MMSTLEQRIAAAEAALARLKYSASKLARADDTKRKVLLGAFLLERFCDGLPDGFDEWLTRPHDRQLFGLPPRLREEK